MGFPRLHKADSLCHNFFISIYDVTTPIAATARMAVGSALAFREPGSAAEIAVWSGGGVQRGS